MTPNDAIMAAAAYDCDPKRRVDTYAPDVPLVWELPHQYSANAGSEVSHDYSRDEQGLTLASLAEFHFPAKHDMRFCTYPEKLISGWLDYCCEHKDLAEEKLRYC